LTLLLLFLACKGGEATTAQSSADSWTGGWTGHIVYREVGGDPEGDVDTAGTLSGLLQVEIADDGATRSLGVRRGDTWADGEDVLAMELSTAGGLSVTSVDGAAVDPPVVLLADPFVSGQSQKSGSTTTTPHTVEGLVTWYGTIPEALEITIDGPADSPITGVLRIAQRVGPVQFVLGDLAGDLAWYE